MSRNYARILNQPIPQSQPIASEQIKNEAGGYTWPVTDWIMLERFLILGSEKGTYYSSEEKLTRQMASAAVRCLDSDPQRVANLLLDVARKNRAAKADPSLLVLALALSHKNINARLSAKVAFSEVIRTPYQLARFLNYITEKPKMRGWGRMLVGLIKKRFTEMDLRDLAYHAVKYRNRDGWETRDMLRVGHPKTMDEGRNLLFNWMAKKSTEEQILGMPPSLRLITGFHLVNNAKTEAEVIQLIHTYRLTWEMLPTQWLRSQSVWKALLPYVPITALVRNLGRLTSIGLLSNLGDPDVAEYVVQRLRTQTKVHPFNILNASRVYQSGKGDKGHLSWTPVNEIGSALTDAFYSGFASVEPTGKRILLGIDVSGSMHGTNLVGSSISAYEGAAVMAMAIARTEKQYQVVAFDTRDYPMTISARQELGDVVDRIRKTGGGGTNCAIPLEYARQHKLPVDGFVILTDSQTWQGNIHPANALELYRREMNMPRTKMAVMAMASNNHSIADPGDAGIINVVGFDTTGLQVIREFVGS